MYSKSEAKKRRLNIGSSELKRVKAILKRNEGKPEAQIRDLKKRILDKTEENADIVNDVIYSRILSISRQTGNTEEMGRAAQWLIWKKPYDKKILKIFMSYGSEPEKEKFSDSMYLRGAGFQKSGNYNEAKRCLEIANTVFPHSYRIFAVLTLIDICMDFNQLMFEKEMNGNKDRILSLCENLYKKHLKKTILKKSQFFLYMLIFLLVKDNSKSDFVEDLYEFIKEKFKDEIKHLNQNTVLGQKGNSIRASKKAVHSQIFT